MSTDKRPPAILLMGPTASGKTDLAMMLHERLGCELISVDSAMIYRGMDIGTAKPTPAELSRAPHRLIDIRDPAEPYSAAQFRDDARREMQRITARGRVPLLVGGTMLYFKSLVEGLSELPAADPGVRAELEARAAREGMGALHETLHRIDPEAGARIHPNDPQRLIRALEVYYVSGRTLSALWRGQRRETFAWRPLSIGLVPARRSELHERIARRFRRMIDEGFLEEVAGLRQRGDLHLELPSMKSVGYRQIWQYLDGAFDRQALMEKGIVATRQLAKRQLTWLRRWPDLHRVDSLAPGYEEKVAKIVRRCGT